MLFIFRRSLGPSRREREENIVKHFSAELEKLLSGGSEGTRITHRSAPSALVSRPECCGFKEHLTFVRWSEVERASFRS
jgi:hypothetical protein